MSSQIDRIAEELQKQALAGYSQIVIDHAQNPRNAGSIPDANGFAKITGPCGDTMAIWLRVKGEVVELATFWTDGCGTTIAVGSMVTELAKGKTVAELLGLTQQGVLDALGGSPPDSAHCALLAANTIKEAVQDYLATKREPWKQAYRKVPEL